MDISKVKLQVLLRLLTLHDQKDAITGKPYAPGYAITPVGSRAVEFNQYLAMPPDGITERFQMILRSVARWLPVR